MTNPPNGDKLKDIYYSMGIYHLERENFDQALSSFAQAQQYGHPEASRCLAEAEQAKQRKAEAEVKRKVTTFPPTRTVFQGGGATRRDFLNWLRFGSVGLGGSLLWERLYPQPSVAIVNPLSSPITNPPAPTETLTTGLTPDASQKPLLSRTTLTDYSELDRALRNRQWKKAENLTRTLMVTVANRTSQDWLNEDSFRRFPGEDLKRIDRLWVQHSNGKLGFSVQKRIWQECGSPGRGRESDIQAWKKFGQRVNWLGGTGGGGWRNRSEIDYSNPQKYPGHLPALFGGFICGTDVISFVLCLARRSEL